MKKQICTYCGADQFVIKQQFKGYAGVVNEEAKFFSGGGAWLFTTKSVKTAALSTEVLSKILINYKGVRQKS